MEKTVTVALLGTGVMGAGMARNLGAAGLDLRVWNRTRERAEPLGDVARVCDTVAEAVSGADVVVTMLYDADSVAQCVEQGRGSFTESAVWVQSSTVGVAGASRLGELAADLGLDYVDAPVLGTKKPAEDGALVVLASGSEGLRERVAPVLDAVGSRTMWVGGAGQGSSLKLACNSWVATVVQGVAESLAMAQALGVEPRLFLEAVSGGALDAPYVGLKGQAMLDGDMKPSFALAGVLKDLELMGEAVAGTDLELHLLPALHGAFANAVEQGHGGLDLAATYLSL